jgi:periplasmic divalent cation tolerance protein
MESDHFCVVLTTTGKKEEAHQLAEWLVTNQLAACVQITTIDSVYRWEGKISHAVEFLLIIKTARNLYQEIETGILANHSYEIPEVIKIDIHEGNGPYLNWIQENVRN